MKLEKICGTKVKFRWSPIWRSTTKCPFGKKTSSGEIIRVCANDWNCKYCKNFIAENKSKGFIICKGEAK